MLAIEKTNIAQRDSIYPLENGIRLYAKTLTAPGKSGRTAIFIHGGGSGGNHTIVCRPSYYFINRGVFSQVIMPDRRGAGNSSPITSVMTYEDNAKDLKRLLDSMGYTQKITAIGVSYGGPIALSLAAIDPRVEEVLLIASSPSLKPANGFVGFLYRKGILEKIVKSVYGGIIGKLSSQYTDFDGAYDAKNVADLKKIFLNAIKRTDKSRLDSLLLENASTCDISNAGIDKRFRITVPVYRVIGTKDETWEVDIEDKYKEQIPNMKSVYIQNAGHKDVFFRAQEFYHALLDLKNNNLASDAPQRNAAKTEGRSELTG